MTNETSPATTTATSEPNSQVPQQQDEQRPTGRFMGRTALITGTSDKGIGGAIAERLAREGASVIMLSRTAPKRLLKLLDKLNLPHQFVQGDVTRTQDTANVVDKCLDEYGKIDILINNAGMEIAKPLEQFSDEQWRQLIDVNLHGAINLSRAALPHMVEPGGVIVNVASALALGGCNGFSIYSASKAGLIGFTQSLAWELAPRGIRVVAVAPGLVHTPMIHKHIDRLTQGVMQQINACHPLGMGSPHDVAAAVTFLASPEARWITGITLPLGWASHFPLPTEALMS